MYNKFSFLNKNTHSFYENNNLNKDIFGNRRVNFMSVSAAGGASNIYPTQQQTVPQKTATQGNQQAPNQGNQETGETGNKRGQHSPVSQLYTPSGAT